MTNRLIAFVIDRLRDERSFTSVAREINTSVTTVIRIFDLVSYPKAELSQTLSIDEFKGNTSGEKYQCILTDPVNKVVLDILPERYGHYLSGYFKGFSIENRTKVEHFVSDMWKTYAETSATWFKNATQIVDKYHWIRQAIWAFENVRKEEQKKFSKTHRRYFKRSRALLIKRFDELTDEQKQQVNVMLYISPNLSRAHWYKESFLKILDNPERRLYEIGSKVLYAVSYLNLKSALRQCKTGLLALLTLWILPLQTDLPKVVTIKSRFSSAMLTATKILNASETVFYISFLISIF